MKRLLVLLSATLAAPLPAQVISDAGSECLRFQSSGAICYVAGKQAESEGNKPQALSFYRKGAEKRDAFCKSNLARLCLFDDSLSCKAEGARQAKDACLAGNAKGCIWYAQALLSKGKQKELATWYKKACDLGDANGCSMLATEVATEELGRYDIGGGTAQGLALLYKACQLEENANGLNCIRLAKNSTGVLSKWAYRKSCDNGNAASCFYLAEALQADDYAANKTFIQNVYSSVCYKNIWPYGKEKACKKIEELYNR